MRKAFLGRGVDWHVNGADNRTHERNSWVLNFALNFRYIFYFMVQCDMIFRADHLWKFQHIFVRISSICFYPKATVFRSYQQDKEKALLQYSLLKERPVVLMLIDCPCKSWRFWYLKLQLRFDKNESDCFSSLKVSLRSYYRMNFGCLFNCTILNLVVELLITYNNRP